MPTTTFKVQTASRKRAKIKIGLSGPSGSGKTYSALLLARGMAGSWEKVVLIDTENGSGELYSDLGKYKIITFEKPYSPERYTEAIDAAMAAGAEVIVVDSISHEWNGEGGILEIADQMPGNSFQNWAKITPRHNRFMNKILNSKVHFICTLRKKVDYSMDKDEKTGKTTVKKHGLKDIQREGVDYEFTIAFGINLDHYAITSKDRTGEFSNVTEILTEKTGEQILKWCESGKADNPSDEIVIKIGELFDALEVGEDQRVQTIAKFSATKISDMSSADAEKLKLLLEEKIAAKSGGEKKDPPPPAAPPKTEKPDPVQEDNQPEQPPKTKPAPPKKAAPKAKPTIDDDSSEVQKLSIEILEMISCADNEKEFQKARLKFAQNAAKFSKGTSDIISEQITKKTQLLAGKSKK